MELVRSVIWRYRGSESNFQPLLRFGRFWRETLTKYRELIRNPHSLLSMTYQEFKTASEALRRFLKEQEGLQTIVDILSPTSTGIIEFGGEFIDQYINVVEIALGDEYGYFSWFVFENDFGREKRSITVTHDIRRRDLQKTYKITNEKQFYKFITDDKR